jgi:hypothetical protein
MRCVATSRLILIWQRPILSTIMFLTETGASLREAFWCDSTDASRDPMDQNYRFCSFGFHPRLRSRTPTLLRNGGSRLCKENHGQDLAWGDTGTSGASTHQLISERSAVIEPKTVTPRRRSSSTLSAELTFPTRSFGAF